MKMKRAQKRYQKKQIRQYKMKNKYSVKVAEYLFKMEIEL